MPYAHLFAPVTVGRMALPHRVVLTQHAASWSDTEYPGKRYGDYLEERARGGAAWIAMLAGPSHPFSTPRGVKPAVVGWESSIVPYIGRIADRVKPYGVKLSTNFLHTGHNTFGWETYRPNQAPSPIASTYREIPRAMTKSEIEDLIDYWGRTARNLKAAGLDAIEIQTSADYLFGSFLSPALNKREDDYGGSLENRARFAIEMLRRLRAETGPDFTLGIRTSGSHLMPGGYDIDEAVAFCQMVDQTGLIDYISVIVGSYYSMAQIITPSSVAGGNAVDYAARIKAVVAAKVIVTGKLHDPADADRVIAEGKADLVGVTRAQLVDPYWIAKAREGRPEDIRPCTYCNHCVARLNQRKEIQCAVSPEFGYEAMYGADRRRAPADVVKSVVVVGGGPAGMEAARVAAERGHRVRLYEASDRLGGQIAIAALAPNRQDWARFTAWQARQLDRLGVAVQLGHRVTADDPALQDADTIIVATGSTPLRDGLSPLVPGAPPALASDRIVTSWEALQSPETLGDTVVIYDEVATIVGPSVAQFLADRGKTVHIVTTAPNVGAPYLFDTTEAPIIVGALVRAGVQVHPLTVLTAVHDRAVHLAHLYAGTPTVIDADSVVLITGGKANTALYDALLAAGRPVVAVGDCLAPRTMQLAIADGFHAGFTA